MTGERHGSPRTLKILQLYPKTDYFTGAAIQLRELARGLAARGHSIVVATPPRRSRRAPSAWCPCTSTDSR